MITENLVIPIRIEGEEMLKAITKAEERGDYTVQPAIVAGLAAALNDTFQRLCLVQSINSNGVFHVGEIMSIDE